MITSSKRDTSENMNHGKKTLTIPSPPPPLRRPLYSAPPPPMYAPYSYTGRLIYIWHPCTSKTARPSAPRNVHALPPPLPSPPRPDVGRRRAEADPGRRSQETGAGRLRPLLRERRRDRPLPSPPSSLPAEKRKIWFSIVGPDPELSELIGSRSGII